MCVVSVQCIESQGLGNSLSVGRPGPLLSSENSRKQVDIGLQRDGSGFKTQFELCEFYIVKYQYYKKCQRLQNILQSYT